MSASTTVATESAPRSEGEPGNARRAALAAWIGPLLVAIFAGVLRFHRVGFPGTFTFDESYYAKDAWSLLLFGTEHRPLNGSDRLVYQGQADFFAPWANGATVHPPVGKWMIAVGEQLFGLNAFGWRFSAALVGALCVLVLARVARRMTGSTWLGCVAGFLLALDSLHFVLSRSALLDVFLVFWVLAGFACLVVDRDRARERLARLEPGQDVPSGLRGWRSRLRDVRWWRVAAGVCLGLAVGTKWNGVFFVAAFGLLTVAWDYSARRAAGRPNLRDWLRLDAVPAFASVVLVGAAAYLASWAGWFASSTGRFRGWAEGKDSAFAFVPDALRSWWHLHAEVLRFHEALARPHPYDSQPWEWLFGARPMVFYPMRGSRTTLACEGTECARQIIAVGMPSIWWFGVFAILAMLVWWLADHDWRAGAILVTIGAGWAPWLLFPERTKFIFYAAPYMPFTILALTLLLGVMAGRRGAGRVRRAAGLTGVSLYLLLVVVNFVYLYPVLTAAMIPRMDWTTRIFFP